MVDKRVFEISSKKYVYQAFLLNIFFKNIILMTQLSIHSSE